MISKRLLSTQVLLAAALVLPHQALGKTKKNELAEDQERVFSVGVPKSEIHLQSMRYEAKPPTEYSLSVTTWVPRKFTRGSYSGAASSFERSSLPAVTINRMGDWGMIGSHLHFSAKIGLSYLAMERTQTNRTGNISEGTSTEALNFFIGRVGVESSLLNRLPWGLEPNLGVALLPTWLTGQASSFEDSLSAYGTPIEATVGMLWRAPMRSSLLGGDLSLGLSGQGIWGSIAGSSLNGYGVQGEVRISL